MEISKQAKNMAKQNGLDTDVCQAYIDCVGAEYATAEDCEEAYQGKFDNDEDFARDMADNLGLQIPDQWPTSCIDWEWAARELMMDYQESDGYYFRSL